MNHYPADRPFIKGILSALPTSIAGSVRNTYSYQYDHQYKNAGRQAANLFLLMQYTGKCWKWCFTLGRAKS